jgi:hypothetical protein
MRQSACTLPILVILLLATQSASALTTSWQYPLGNWSTGSWSLGEPNLTRTAVINNGGTCQITQPVEFCLELFIGQSTSDCGTVQMLSGSLNVVQSEVVGQEGEGTFTQSGGIHDVADTLFVGQGGNGGAGHFDVSGTAQLDVGGLNLGRSESDGIFTQTGGTVTVDCDIVMGELTYGDGKYTLSGGTLNVGGDVTGGFGDSTLIYDGGTLNVTGTIAPEEFHLGDALGTNVSFALGAGKQVTTRYQRVGNNGTAVFTHTGGTNTSSSWLVLGGQADGNGTYHLNGSGVLTVSSQEQVGAFGLGLFTQDGGTHTVNGTLVAGAWSDADGRYDLKNGPLKTNGSTISNEAVGTFTQSGGTHTVNGSLVVAYRTGSNGSYDLTSGTVTSTDLTVANGAYSRPGLAVGAFTQSDGNNTVANSVILGRFPATQGTYTISGGILHATNFTVGQDGNGTFNVTGAGADITFSNLKFGPHSVFAAVPGTTIKLSPSSLTNENTDGVDLEGLANTRLIYAGTISTGTFEAAGEDQGRILDGFVNNFALDELELEAGVSVRLEDLFDNAHRFGPGGDDETLYLRGLVLGAGATLDLNGLKLYIQGISDAGGNITGGQLVSMIPGDATGDFRIDGGDLAIWQQNYAPLGSGNSTFALGDFNGDGKVDGGDLALWQQHYDPLGVLDGDGSMPLGEVPEPATVILLTMGVLSATFIRRGGKKGTDRSRPQARGTEAPPFLDPTAFESKRLS